MSLEGAMGTRPCRPISPSCFATHTLRTTPAPSPPQPFEQNGVCPLVVLTNPDKEAYMLMDMNEVLVQRRVRVMGHPAVLPTIDAMMGMRAFTVGAGGYLELQFVRVRQSMGMYRERYGLEGRKGLGTQVLEIRGGSVMLEAGAEGADFLGVVFLMVVRAMRGWVGWGWV
jgi:hypothetical protein